MAIQSRPNTIPRTERAIAIPEIKLIIKTIIPYGEMAVVLAAEGTAHSTKVEKDASLISEINLPEGQAASAFFENKPAVKSRLAKDNFDLILVKSKLFI